ncbi:phosphatidylcholine-hydrolyzing phospholipase D protein, partial [Chlamydia suis MD56]
HCQNSSSTQTIGRGSSKNSLFPIRRRPWRGHFTRPLCQTKTLKSTKSIPIKRSLLDTTLPLFVLNWESSITGELSRDAHCNETLWFMI